MGIGTLLFWIKCIFHLKKEGTSLWPLKQHLTHRNHTILPRLIHCHHDEWGKFVWWGDEGSITSWLGKDQFCTIPSDVFVWEACHPPTVLFENTQYKLQKVAIVWGVQNKGVCDAARSKGESVHGECQKIIEVIAHQCWCLSICQN